MCDGPPLVPKARKGCRTAALSALWGKSPRGLPQTLWRQAVYVLLGVRGCAEPAVPGDTGERIGVEARQLPLLDQQVDHSHRGFFHRLVEVGVAGMRNMVRCRVLRRQRARRLRLRILRIEAVGPL